MGIARLELLRSDAPASYELGADVPGEPSAPEALSSTQRIRVVDGALRCVARQGVAKTTLDDVAKEAGCSRATVYRVFPGGKDAVLAAAVDTEVSRFFSALAVRMGEAAEIEDVLVGGITEAATRITGHRAVSFLLETEPEVVLPHLAFAQMDAVLEVSSAFTAPFLGRWLDHCEAKRVAEWATRIVLSYLACPAEGVDLTDPESVRRLVRTFVVPGIRTLRSDAGGSANRRSRIPKPDNQKLNSQKPSTGRPSTGRPTTIRPTTGKGEVS